MWCRSLKFCSYNNPQFIKKQIIVATSQWTLYFKGPQCNIFGKMPTSLKASRMCLACALSQMHLDLRDCQHWQTPLPPNSVISLYFTATKFQQQFCRSLAYLRHSFAAKVHSQSLTYKFRHLNTMQCCTLAGLVAAVRWEWICVCLCSILLTVSKFNLLRVLPVKNIYCETGTLPQEENKENFASERQTLWVHSLPGACPGQPLESAMGVQHLLLLISTQPVPWITRDLGVIRW